MNCYAYIRVSSKGQLDGDGPERQREAIIAFCNKFAIENQGEFLDSITGDSDCLERPKFFEMMKNIERRNALGDPRLKIDCIVIEKLDRLARHMMPSEMILKECRTRGIQVFAADQGQTVNIACDSDDPSRTMMRQIMMAIAQWDKAMILLRTQSACSRIRRETGRCGGKRAYGMKIGEGAIVNLIRQLHNEGKRSHEIAEELNKQGLKTRQGKAWDRFSVHHVRCGKRSRPLFKVGKKQIDQVNPFTISLTAVDPERQKACEEKVFNTLISTPGAMLTR